MIGEQDWLRQQHPTPAHRAHSRAPRGRGPAAKTEPRVGFAPGARKVLITVGLTPQQEAEYALNYGVDRADLRPEAQTEYDRLLAEVGRTSPTRPQSADQVDWIAALVAASANLLPSRLLKAARRHRRRLSEAASSIAPVAIIALILALLPSHDSFQKLQTELANVHFPPGYRLLSERRAGSDCAHDQCVVIQTWEWARSSRRTTSAACADVFGALDAAYSGAESDDPGPAHSSCGYFSGPQFINPKTSLEVIVYNGQAQANSGFLIVLTAEYIDAPDVYWPPANRI